MAVKFKIPSTLGACADKLYELRTERLEYQKMAESIKAEEVFLTQYLMTVLPDLESTGIAGTKASANIKTDSIPVVTDWEELRTYIKDTDSWDLIQKRLSTSAVKLRLDEGVEVPGTGIYLASTISLTKVK